MEDKYEHQEVIDLSEMGLSLSKKKEMYPLLDSLTKSYGRWCDYPDVDGLRRDLKKLYEKGEYQEMYNFFTERFEYWVTFK